jgi:hypothetical protein
LQQLSNTKFTLFSIKVSIQDDTFVVLLVHRINIINFKPNLQDMRSPDTSSLQHLVLRKQRPDHFDFALYRGRGGHRVDVIKEGQEDNQERRDPSLCVISGPFQKINCFIRSIGMKDMAKGIRLSRSMAMVDYATISIFYSSIMIVTINK